jgi:hypothetical protein
MSERRNEEAPRELEGESAYLWDPSAPRTDELVRMEELLRRFRHVPGEPARDPAPLARGRELLRGARRALPAAWALAAGLLVALCAWLWIAHGSSDAAGYRVEGLDGVTRLSVGRWLETPDGALVRLAIDDLGMVEVEPQARLIVEERGRALHRLFLERGALEARISAPPRLFQVGTPAGLSVDLGCRYRLAVDAAGRTDMRVTLGQVSFETDGRRAYVPAGARCRSVRDRGPSSAVWSASTPELLDAVEALDFAASAEPAAIERVVRHADVDSLTLWHLLGARSPEVRAAAWKRLAELVPAPADVSLDQALALEHEGFARVCAGWLERMPWYRERW